jgi:hypothetical protein
MGKADRCRRSNEYRPPRVAAAAVRFYAPSVTDPYFAPAPARPAVFRAGLAVNRALATLVHNFPAFWSVAAVVTLPDLVVEASRGDDFLWTILASVVSGVLAYASQAVLADAAFQSLEGGVVDVSRSMQVVLTRFFALAGLAGWVGLAVGIGFVLLIVPGLICLVMFAVAVPVCVVEGRSAFASMQRSAALTSGYRWPLFWLYLMLGLVLWMTMLVLQQALAQIGGDMVQTLGVWALRAAVTAFHAVLGVVIYRDLRAAKEGG